MVQVSTELAGDRTPLSDGAPQQCWLSWLSSLSLVKVRFRCNAVTPVEFLPRELGYKGNAFHTRFEAALARGWPDAHKLLCAQLDSGRKPYVLIPPLDGLTVYPATLRFDVELLLIGTAINYLAACREAMVDAGKLECGTMRGSFEVNAVEHVLPSCTLETADVVRKDGGESTYCIRADQLCLTSARADRLTLRLLTPLRVHGASRQIPTFHALTRSLLRRATALGSFDPSVGPEDEANTVALLRLAKSIEARDATLSWFDWERASPFKDTWMKLGGYVGSLDFVGEVSPFIPWLRLGEWLHVGGKTSFGLGKYQLVLSE